MSSNLNIEKTKTRKTYNRIRDDSSQIISGDGILTTFNNFYVSVGPNLAKKFPSIHNSVYRQIDVREQLYFRFVGTKEVNSVIRQLKNNKSSCVHDMSMGILKDAMSILLVEFTHLINECLTSSVMPVAWKVGTVTPIPKGSTSLNVGDYRPISVLPGPSKVIERIVYNQLVYYLETNPLLDNRQHGFRKGFSTASAIMEVTDYIYESIDGGNYVHCAFIDYSKAFYTLKGHSGQNLQILCETKITF